jgi:hypothetical protein
VVDKSQGVATMTRSAVPVEMPGAAIPWGASVADLALIRILCYLGFVGISTSCSYILYTLDTKHSHEL